MIRIPFPPAVCAGTDATTRNIALSSAAVLISEGDPARARVCIAMVPGAGMVAGQEVSVGVLRDGQFAALATLTYDHQSFTLRIEDYGSVLCEPLYGISSADSAVSVTIVRVIDPHGAR